MEASFLSVGAFFFAPFSFPLMTLVFAYAWEKKRPRAFLAANSVWRAFFGIAIKKFFFARQTAVPSTAEIVI